MVKPMVLRDLDVSLLVLRVLIVRLLAYDPWF